MIEKHQHNTPWSSFIYCPSCGAMAIELRPDRSIICKTCSHHYYFNVAAAVAGIITDDIGRLLMTVRANDPGKGSLDLPGGFVDYEESAEEALKREIKEELNLEVNKLSYFQSFPNIYIFDNVIYKTLDLVYKCTIESFANQRLSDEILDVTFIRPAEIILDKIAFTSIRNVVSSFKQSGKI